MEFLARTELRLGEFRGLTTDAVVQIGSAYCLRVPIGKLHKDRYIPLHPQLKPILDEWLVDRPPELRTNHVFMHRGRRISRAWVWKGLRRVARAAGIGRVTPHQAQGVTQARDHLQPPALLKRLGYVDELTIVNYSFR